MVSINLDALGQAAQKVATAHLHHLRLIQLHRRANFHLNIFRSTLANKHIKGFAHITHDGSINSVATAAHALRNNNTAQGNNCYLASAPANINNHATGCLLHGHACANSCCHGLLNQISLTRTGFNSSINNSALFYLGNAAWHTNQNTRAHKGAVTHSLLNKILQHGLGNFVVSNNAILHRANRHNIAGSTTNHALRLGTNRQNLVGILFHSHN